MTKDTNIFAAFGAFPGASAFEKLFADATERSEEAVKRSRKAAEDLADLYRGNVEAFVEAGKIAATGAQTIGQDLFAKNRDGLEQTASREEPDRASATAERLRSHRLRPFRRRELGADRVGRQACRRGVPASLEPRQRERREAQQDRRLTISSPSRQAQQGGRSPHGAAAFFLRLTHRSRLAGRSTRALSMGGL